MKTVKKGERLRCRITLPLLVTLALLLAAFSTGSPVFLTGAVLIALLCLSSVLGVWMASRTMTVSGDLSDRRVQRGEKVTLEVTLHYRSLIPVAPLLVEMGSGVDQDNRTMLVDAASGEPVMFELPCNAAHVGVMEAGVEAVTVTDLFGMCSRRVEPRREGSGLIVLPQTFEVGAQVYAAGDSGSESMARASEDVTSPAEVRAWQMGDPMRKIHWKLSARKRELMVRRYEAPVMPDALILLDCAEPPRQAGVEAMLDVKDALLETAASIMAESTRTEHPARLPLLGRHPIELDKAMGMPAVLESLAHVDFSAGESFEQVLHLEMRRMRKVGSTIVITARLNSRMVDVMRSMRRMGPYVRLYLVTFNPEDPAILPMVSRLQNAGVEVCYVTPLAM